MPNEGVTFVRKFYAKTFSKKAQSDRTDYLPT